MANKAANPDPDDLRKDLLAALAAGRELGPEMDASIVDAHLRRHYGDAAKPKPAATPAVVEQRPFQPAAYLPGLMMVLGMAAYITILIVTHGAFWWLFWPFMAWGWGWWGWGGRRRYGARDARWQYRRYRRYGDWGDDPYEVGYNAQAGGRASSSAPRDYV